MWTEKYAPQNFEKESEKDYFMGNEKNILKIGKWLQDWEDVVIKQNKKNPATTAWGAGPFPSKIDPNRKYFLLIKKKHFNWLELFLHKKKPFNWLEMIYHLVTDCNHDQ